MLLDLHCLLQGVFLRSAGLILVGSGMTFGCQEVIYSPLTWFLTHGIHVAEVRQNAELQDDDSKCFSNRGAIEYIRSKCLDSLMEVVTFVA